MVTFTGNSVGDTATYTCNLGFELVGSATATCGQVDVNSAVFSPAPPECRPLCPDPPALVNGMVTFTGNSVGDTATYTCNSGFKLIGSAMVTCTQVDGNTAVFSPAPPECRPLCPDPPALVNGAVTFTGNSVGDTATYTCNAGLELIGSATVMCMQLNANSAAFSPAPPVCASAAVTYEAKVLRGNSQSCLAGEQHEMLLNQIDSELAALLETFVIMNRKK